MKINLVDYDQKDIKPFKISANLGGGGFITTDQLIKDIGPGGRKALAKTLVFLFDDELTKAGVHIIVEDEPILY